MSYLLELKLQSVYFFLIPSKLFLAERLDHLPKGNVDWRESPETPSFQMLKKVAPFGHVYWLVYARHGRELMGFKSPVSVPVLCNIA